jgi:glycerophosphoryl diester phosphodiesterase
VVAHRGCSEEAPENTLPAFERAIAGGIEIVECDVHLSRDGVPVVIHDATLDRTTDARGAVAERDWSELAAVGAGYASRFGETFSDTTLPSLEQLLDLCRGRCEVMIEIKRAAVGARGGGIEEAVLSALRRAGAEDAAMVISMDPRALRRVAAMAPGLPRGLVFPRRAWRRLVERTVAVDAGWLIASSAYLRRSPKVVGRALAAGLRVGAYVVNEESLLERLVRIGVDSIASDRPLRMAAALATTSHGEARGA